jgi:hypothetical protein
MVDIYTKIVLTVIAAALIAVAVQGAIPSASAQFGQTCGNSQFSPCYVKPSETFNVYVLN